MTKTTLTSYGTLLCMAIATIGVVPAHASEVTGTLSSQASSNPSTSGNISGTVESERSGSSGGRSRRSTSTNQPSGSVLGASTNSGQTPSFPNAGVSPKDAESTTHSLWTSIKAFFKNW
jgi:hypothetical protein